MLSTTLVLMALVVNIRQPGFWLITLGALANFTVIVANGGQMPASPEAFAALNGLPVVPTTDFSNSVIAGPGTPFYFLGDLFVLPRPLPFANVFSIGDVLIGLGGAWFIVAVMHGRGATRPACGPDGTATGKPTRCLTRAMSAMQAALEELCDAVGADAGGAFFVADDDGVLHQVGSSWGRAARRHATSAEAAFR